MSREVRPRCAVSPRSTRSAAAAIFLLTLGATALSASPQPASFTLKRGESLAALCAAVRQSGVDVAVPDCARQILFANRDRFDDRLG